MPQSPETVNVIRRGHRTQGAVAVVALPWYLVSFIACRERRAVSQGELYLDLMISNDIET